MPINGRHETRFLAGDVPLRYTRPRFRTRSPRGQGGSTPPRHPGRESGGIGRRAGLRIQWAQSLGGSTPPSRTTPRLGRTVNPMKVEIQELDPCKRQLVVEAPEEEVRAAWTAACGRVQRDARLPGFRRGKVPMTLVRSRFGDEVRQAVAEALIPAVYRRAVDEAQLSPVEDPEFRELELEEGRPLRFTAVVEIKPAIALGEYRGVTARHSPRPVTDADIETTLAAIAEQRATLVTVLRPARVGDYAVIDYELRPEGGEPRTEQGYAFEVGGGRVLPEMDEAVIGLEADSERQVAVRFPERHPREELRGRTGELSLRVVEVKEKEVPPVDDELVRALGTHDTLAELREAVRARLTTERERQERRALEEKVVDAVLARHEFVVPESLVGREVGHRIQHG